jgi:hypothetical protein
MEKQKLCCPDSNMKEYIRLLTFLIFVQWFVPVYGQTEEPIKIIAGKKWKFEKSWLGDDTVVLKPVVASDTLGDVNTTYKTYWSVNRLRFDQAGKLIQQYCYAECAIGNNPREVINFLLINNKIDVLVRNDFLSHSKLKYLYKIQLCTRERIELVLIPRE